MTGHRFLFPMDEDPTAESSKASAQQKNKRPKRSKPNPSSKRSPNTKRKSANRQSPKGNDVSAGPRLFVDEVSESPASQPDTSAAEFTVPSDEQHAGVAPADNEPSAKSKGQVPILSVVRSESQSIDDPNKLAAPVIPLANENATNLRVVVESAAVANELIRASAGTGKTYQLTSRFLRLLLSDVAPETILATTFTRKAAGEILDRVVSWLGHASVDDQELGKLATAVEMPDLTQEACLSKLVKLTRQMHRLQIHTIDAFFMQMAKSFSLELGMTPGWQVLEEGGAESNVLRGKAIAGVLRQESLEDLLTLIHQLTPKGEAKRSLDQTLVGSVSAAYRLFLESSPEAWDRLDVPAPLPDDELEDVRQALATFPDKRKTIKAAINQDVDRILNEDWAGFFQSGKSLARHINEGATKYGNAKLPPELIALYERFLPHLRSMTLFAARAQTLGTRQFLDKYDQEYRHLKSGQRLYGFDEVTGLLASYTQQGSLSQLAYRMDHGIDHLLLDEFQDTSTTQWRALASLAQRCAGSNDRSFFCVGDVKQAIYGWRGGSSEIFDVLDQKLPNLAESNLQESRRSSPTVIAAVNSIFEFLPNWDEERLGRAKRAAKSWDFPEHSTFHQDMPGYFAIETSPDEKVLSKDTQESAVFRRVAERVAELRAQAPSRTIGILCRRNNKVGQMMNELQRLGIPASEEGGNFLTDSAAVELVLSLLQLTDHPGDSTAAYHLASSPWRNHLGLEAGVCFEYDWEEENPLANDPDRPRPPAGIDPTAIATLIRKVRAQLLHDGFGDTVQTWAQQLRPLCNRREARRLTQLVERAYEYQSKIESPTQLGYQSQRRQSSRPTEFVRFIRETKFADPSSATIRVMTVHQAKGLEFDIVMLPDLLGPFIEGHETFLYRRPDIESNIDLVCRYMGKNSGRSFLPKQFMPLFDDYEDRSARESLCVLYVALTRAAHALHVFLPSGMQKLRGSKCHPGYLIKDTFLPGEALQPNQTVYEMGDAEWFRKCPAPDVVSKEPYVPAPKLARSQPAKRSLETVAPSQIGLSRYVQLRDRLRREPNATRDRGTILHQWLAEIEWLPDGMPSDARLIELAETHAESVNVHELIDQFKNLLELEEVRDVLVPEQFRSDFEKQFGASNGELQFEVRNEQRVAGRDGQNIITGTVDRLVLVRSSSGDLVAAEIIDYKTDSTENPDEAADERRRDRHELQIAAYRRAICASLRLDRVATRLVYLP